MTTSNTLTTLYCGHVIYTSGSPGNVQLITESNGALAVDAHGLVVGCGSYENLIKTFRGAAEVSFGDAMILPGFIDAHVHFPQMAVIGSWGESLLNWLDKFTYPEEQKYADRDYATRWAHRFIRTLAANGTTTAGIFSSNHVEATDILCAEICTKGLRAVVGKTSMDRNAPATLCRNADLDRIDQNFLIGKWHKKNRLISFAINPRFAISCTDSLLSALGELKQKHPDLFVQTHFAENQEEIAAVKSLFPKSKNYLSVYDQFGLLSPETLLGHGIHPTSVELELLTASGAALVHCPSSNNFLGSGLCKVSDLSKSGHNICLGTDIGGGTSFSMFAVMREAYYIQKQLGKSIGAEDLLHLATHAGSRILNKNKQPSCFANGAPADFVVVKWRNNELLSHRLESTANDNERLFATIILGDDRIISSTYVAGKNIYNQSNKEQWS